MALDDVPRVRALQLYERHPQVHAISFLNQDQTEFYQLLTYKDDQDLETKLRVGEGFYNFQRPHGAPAGRTPFEVLRDKLAS